MTYDINKTIEVMSQRGKEIVISKAKAADQAEQARIQELIDTEQDLLSKIKHLLPETPLMDYYTLRPIWNDVPQQHKVQDGNNFYLTIKVPELAPILIVTTIYLNAGDNQCHIVHAKREWVTNWEVTKVTVERYSVCDTYYFDEDAGELYWKCSPGKDCYDIDEAVYYAKKYYDREHAKTA
jgi:hypothetical protein